jgi:acetyl-CoA acetyltransferase
VAQSPTGIPDSRIPVIVGIGEILDRPDDPAKGLEPLALMAEALKNAERDAGSSLLPLIDSLDIVNLVSWRYTDSAAQLCHLLGITPRRAVYGPVGGEGPVRYIHEAALRIASGESKIAAICGAEAQSTVNKAQKSGIALPWTPFAHDAPAPVRGADFQHPMSVALGVARPITVYPFYEAATAAHWGQSPREALKESGDLWSRYASVAENNPASWLKRRFTAEEITTPTADNRLVAWPYTKLMVANPTVNQGAAMLVISLAAARSARIAEDRLVYIHGGAWANEPRDYLDREQYRRSDCQDAVLEAAVQLAEHENTTFNELELYSCFPCVPKMARRKLGLNADIQPTVTGGLTFFGAPLNNYMTHAACAMVRRIRNSVGTGLLYGQGEFVTKHHALVLSSRPPNRPLSLDTSVQSIADQRRGPLPAVVTDASGGGTVETFTVIYDRNGQVQHGVVMLQTPDRSRTLARVRASDRKTIAQLTDLDRSPIGATGPITRADDGLLEWTAITN